MLNAQYYRYGGKETGEVVAIHLFEGEEKVGSILFLESQTGVHIRSTIPFAGYKVYYRYDDKVDEKTNWFGNSKPTYEVDLSAYYQSGNPLAIYTVEALRDICIKRFGVDPGPPPVP